MDEAAIEALVRRLRATLPEGATVGRDGDVLRFVNRTAEPISVTVPLPVEMPPGVRGRIYDENGKVRSVRVL